MSLHRLYPKMQEKKSVEKLNAHTVIVEGQGKDTPYELKYISDEFNKNWSGMGVDTLTVVQGELDSRYNKNKSYIYNSYNQDYLENNISTIV